MLDTKFAVALIGAGGMGKRWAGVLSDFPGVVLKTIMDTDRERVALIAGKYHATAAVDIANAAADPDIDIAVISLPHKFLAPAALELLSVGKHVLLEKPGARSTAELELAIRLAKEKNLRLMVGFNHRFHTSHQVAKKLVSEGKIGEPQFMRMVYGFGGRPGYEKEWRHNIDIAGGGELIDQGVHLIDLARWFLGDFAEACGFNEKAFWKSDVEDNAFALLRTKDGKVASLHASWSEWKPTYRLELYGTAGYIRIEGLGKKYGGTEKVFVGRRTEIYGAGPEEVIDCDPNADNSLRDEFGEFLAAVREKREPSPGAHDGLAALKIVEEIYSHEKEKTDK